MNAGLSLLWLALATWALAWALFAPWTWWPEADLQRPWLPVPTGPGAWRRRCRLWPWRTRRIQVTTSAWWVCTVPGGMCWTAGRQWHEFGFLDRWLYQYQSVAAPGWELPR